MKARSGLAIAAAVAAPVAVAAGLALGLGRPAPTPARPPYLPDPSIVPGEAIPGVTRAETCDPAWTHRSRQVPESLRAAVLRRDGHPSEADRRLYEVDHRLPVSLAGSSSPANLWAQPWQGPYGALRKDLLEASVYRDVCAGRMSLADAQAIFLGDWGKALDARIGPPGSDRDIVPADPEGFPATPPRLPRD